MVGNTLPQTAVVHSAVLGPGTDPVIRADRSGSVFIATSTAIASLPATPGVVQLRCAGSRCADIFVAKLNTTGTALILRQGPSLQISEMG